MDLKELQKEMDEMEDALEIPEAGEEEFHTDAPGTESPGTDIPGTDSPSTEAPGTEAPSTDAPAEDPRDTELRTLREELEDLKMKPVSTDAPSTSAPSSEAPIGEEDFLGDIDLDDLTRDKDVFNKVLNAVYIKGVTAGKTYARDTGEKLIRAIPDITKNTLAVQAQLTETNRKFYEDNKDLIPWKKSVAAVFEEMISTNPGKSYIEILPELAIEVRKRVGLQKSADDKDKDNDAPPKLPKKKGGQRSTIKPELDAIDKEMDEMDKALGLD